VSQALASIDAAERPAGLSAVHVVLLNLLLIADTLFSSRLYRLLGGQSAQQAVLGTALAIILGYAAYAFVRARYMSVLLLALVFGIIIVQTVSFTWLITVTPNFNASLQFLWIGAFIVFASISADGGREYLVRTLFRYATGYTLLYLVLSAAFSVHTLPRQLVDALVLSDPERGERLFCYSSAVALAFLGWAFQAQRQRSLTAVLLCILMAMAVWLTLSRVFILILAIICALIFLTRSFRLISRGTFITLLIVSAVNLYGIVDVGWNPFSFFGDDSSGAFRNIEFFVARAQIWNSPLFGVGIPPSATDLWALARQDFFSSGDLGVTGIWLDFGLVGLAMFFLGSYLCTRPIQAVSDELKWPLSLTGCFIAGYGCLAPVIFYPAGSTYFAVILGLWVGRPAAETSTNRLEQQR